MLKRLEAYLNHYLGLYIEFMEVYRPDIKPSKIHFLYLHFMYLVFGK